MNIASGSTEFVTTKIDIRPSLNLRVGDDNRWAVRAAIDAVVAHACGLSRDQYAHVLSSFERTSYPRPLELCLAHQGELQSIELEAFTKKGDPRWGIPLNESLPSVVSDRA
jgi:hypothetical protein